MPCSSPGTYSDRSFGSNVIVKFIFEPDCFRPHTEPAGTNGVINTFSLLGGYQVQWTGRKVLKLDGSQHHGVGIAPTVSVERTIEGVAEGRDELLERAVLLIEEKR